MPPTPRPALPVRIPLGFTMLELLIVVVIIGLLAGYVGPRYFSQLGKSEQTAAQAQIDGLVKALHAYRLDTGHYPTTAQGLHALVAAPGDEPRWNGPYLQRAVPADPWGRPYVYTSPGREGAEFDLYSVGRDGQAGSAADPNALSYR